MTLERRLSERRDELAEKWADLVLSTYPEETRKLWKQNKDRFTNPVGATIVDVTAKLLELVIVWEDAEEIAAQIDRLVRIRSVQNFTPSQAMSFVFLLKKLLREEFFAELSREGKLDELLRFEPRVDNLALMAFDIYCKGREEIFELRCREIKNAQHNLLKRARMIVDVADE